MEGKVIIEYKGFKAKLTSDTNDSITSLLDNTILGIKGGMRYTLRGIARRISAYNNIRFITLYMGTRIAGTIGLCYRGIWTGHKAYHSSYLRYLSFLPGFQAALDARGLDKSRHRKRDTDSFKSKVLTFFSKPQMLDFPGYEKDDKHVMYAYIESKNERSKNLIHQFGFEHIRTFLTVAFSRFSPKADPGVSPIEEKDKGRMTDLLKDYYDNYSFYTDEFVFHDNRYYVMKEGDEIIAGISAIPSSYTIVNMPGVWGWVFMNVLPFIPYYRRLFQPGEFNFLSLGMIYCKKGREKVLETLMGSVCATEGFNTGLTWVDDRSDLYDMLRGDIKMGVINRMLNAKPGLVYANFINFTDEEKDIFYESPAFISGFDFT
ncbi:MAG TPA: hypothetical protein VMW76_05620 [Bacteroidales bacterium]|nr:hypothetical protein [Bacteroidales bacterium]